MLLFGDNHCLFLLNRSYIFDHSTDIRWKLIDGCFTRRLMITLEVGIYSFGRQSNLVRGCNGTGICLFL